MVLPWDLGNHENYDGNLVGGCLCVDSKLSTLVKKQTYLVCCKPTLSTELVVRVVVVMDKI